IGEPDAVRSGRHLDGKDAVRIMAFDPLPIVAVARHAGIITFPAERVGRTSAIEDAQFDRLSAGAGQSEEEPLVEIGLMVLGDFEVDTGAVDGDDADVAAVKGA